MFGDELCQPVVILFPDLVRHHRFERGSRHLQIEVHRSAVAFVDDEWRTDNLVCRDRQDCLSSTSHEIFSNLLDRILRRRESYPV